MRHDVQVHQRNLIDQYGLYRGAIQENKAKYMDPWSRFKRTYLIVAYFNVIVPPTVFASWFRYSPESLKIFAEFIPTSVFMMLPLVGAIGFPILNGLLEMAFNCCCKCKIVPGNPDVHDSIPFVILAPILDQLFHKIIKPLLGLKQYEVVCLVVVSTLLQIMQAGIGGYASQYRFLLDGLFHESLFTTLGQIVLFGKLLPKLLGLLPKRIKGPVVAIENRIDAGCHRLFSCCSANDDVDNIRLEGGLSPLSV